MILEESTGFSTGSTHTAIMVPAEEFLDIPLGFGGAIFNISADEPSFNGETQEQRTARVKRNTTRATRRAEDDAVARG